MPDRITHLSATVYAGPLEGSRNGVQEQRHIGIVTPATIGRLRRRSLEAARHAPAIVFRFERSVFAMDRIPEIPIDLYAVAQAPAAVVVRPDQYEFWQEFADRLMQQAGVLRAVFLESNLDLARRWAEVEALAKCAGSQTARRSALAAALSRRVSRPAYSQVALPQS